MCRHVKTCRRCQERKAPQHRKRAQMVTYQVGAAWERVAIDVMGPLPQTQAGNKYILVIQDYFTKWVECHAMPDQTADTVARILVDQVFTKFGCPRELHSDQGANFESAIFQETCRLFGVRKTRTTSYHPRSDGMVELHNRTLQDMLSKCVNDRQDDWDQCLQLAAMAYRSTPHETTGETPNMLNCG